MVVSVDYVAEYHLVTVCFTQSKPDLHFDYSIKMMYFLSSFEFVSNTCLESVKFLVHLRQLQYQPIYVSKL